MGRVGGPSSRVICGFEARLRYCGVAKQERHRPHKPDIRGFESRPRYASGRRQAGQSLVAQWQSDRLLTGLSGFESLLGSTSQRL